MSDDRDYTDWIILSAALILLAIFLGGFIVWLLSR